MITDAFWNHVSEKNKVKYKPFEEDYCVEYEDCMDGFVIHTASCPRYQDSAMSGTGCVGLRRATYWPIGLREVK